ncbi:MAG TPA: hypothetical protein PKI03_09155 [Pseudomonadota bacterium]|nr:hypothetical protein [Pseudomonadota bacterium]
MRSTLLPRLRWFSVVALLSAAAVACSTMVLGNGNGGGDGSEADGGSGPGPRDLSFDPDAFWAQDPPPMYCGLDGGTLPAPMPPGGTPECPDDKNRQGCACPKLGDTAACWPGLRKNRGLGICRDGVTTCVRNGEIGTVWGPCEGYILPIPGTTTGKEACNCFSAGRWAIDNVVPCFYTARDGKHMGSASSVLTGTTPTCEEMMDGKLMVPSKPWSPNKLTVDCVGHFRLCYTIKAGDVKNPLPTDCVVASVCTEGDYPAASAESPLPVLPAWATTTPAQVACSEQFKKSGGYGEMSVDGKTVTCELVQKPFNRVGYCPLDCDKRPMDPDCKSCMSGGSGSF